MPLATAPATASTYWSLSRAPRYSLTFALPLLVLYEAMALAVNPSSGLVIRNGADVLLKGLAASLLGERGPAVFGVLLVAGLVGLAARDAWTHPGGLRPRVLVVMLLEAAALAVAFGIVVGLVTAQLLNLASLAIGQIESVAWPTALMVSLGAGLYEELLFRVLLVSALLFAARTLLGLSRGPAGVFAVVVGALIFSAFHYVGPYGDALQAPSFVFRAVAGVAFSALYVIRGFGITAWTHALYDVFLLAATGR
ncbi:MAG TPA: CPBP family intramembrane glutamic endopeptidase [Gemmatimonadaceae bacterium]